jgi:hypothetical protein
VNDTQFDKAERLVLVATALNPGAPRETIEYGANLMRLRGDQFRPFSEVWESLVKRRMVRKAHLMAGDEWVVAERGKAALLAFLAEADLEKPDDEAFEIPQRIERPGDADPFDVLRVSEVKGNAVVSILGTWSGTERQESVEFTSDSPNTVQGLMFLMWCMARDAQRLPAFGRFSFRQRSSP